MRRNQNTTLLVQGSRGVNRKPGGGGRIGPLAAGGADHDLVMTCVSDTRRRRQTFCMLPSSARCVGHDEEKIAFHVSV